MNKLFALAALLLAFSGVAQKSYYSDYDWSETPKTWDLTDKEKEEGEIVLFEKRGTELANNDAGELREFQLMHTIKRLNSDQAIEENNKYFVSNYSAEDIVFQKARAIQPDGSVIEVSNKDIKESLDEDGNVEYQYFAFEGIELGSIIEYLHLIKFEPHLTGAVFTVQSDIPKKHVEYDLITPEYLDYKVFPVNGLPEFKRDSTNLDFRQYILRMDDVEALKSETSSSYRANLMKAYYKLDKNYSSGKSNFFNYTEVSRIIHFRLFEEPKKKNLKLIRKLIDRAEIEKDDSETEQVRKIEKQVKKEFVILQGFNLQMDDPIAFTFESKLASEEAITRILLNCFREQGIPFELILTTDRTVDKFYTEYEAYNFLDDYIFYLPDLKMYLSPHPYSRLGFPPYEFTGTKGLSIKEVAVGKIVTFDSKVKEIGYTDADKSRDIINTTTSLNDDLSTATIQVERSTSGYKSLYYQASMDYLDEEQKTELKEGYLNYIDDGAKVEDMSFENDDTDLYGQKPLIGKGTIESANFTENAGEKVLFKVGMLIGPQAEMYDEDKRKIPVETEFTRRYERKIVFNVPEGYEIKNPEVLNMEVVPTLNGKTPIGFKSTYTLENGVLTVTVTEWYEDIYYPLAQFEEYKSVINAAADFNKLVLVLQKIN